jgi:hypothetical protein
MLQLVCFSLASKKFSLHFIQYNKRYQDNDIQQFNWHQPMQRSEYQQIKKQSSHQTPVHYQIPIGDISPKINTPWPSNQHRMSQHIYQVYYSPYV